MADFSSAYIPTWKVKNTFQMEEQDKISEKKLSEIQISNLPDEEFKIMVLKMLMSSGEHWMNKVRTSTKERKNKKVPMAVTELKNIKTDVKNILEGFNNRLEEAKERISKLEDKVLEFIKSEEKKKMD